jgi:hypothetical protein
MLIFRIALMNVDKLSFVTLSLALSYCWPKCRYTKCRYAGCRSVCCQIYFKHFFVFMSVGTHMEQEQVVDGKG